MELSENLSEKARHDYMLVQRAVNDGDQSAYAELMSRYQESITFMLMKMVRNPVDAEDLTIEAFAKAFNRLAQYKPSYAFSTWLFKVATNNCIDFIRRKKKNVLSLDNSLINDQGGSISINIEDGGLDPEESIIKDQKKVIMREVVEKLKPHYRQLVELRYFKEYSYDEIAKELDLPIGTVKAQLFRARDFLYNMLRNKKEKI